MKFHWVASHWSSWLQSFSKLCPGAGGTDNLIHPVAPAPNRIKGEVGGTLVYGALDPGARVTEAVDELFAAEWVRKDPNIQAVRQPVRQDPHLRS